jgi:hypothetical protein
VGGSQLLAGVEAAALASEPFAVEEMGAGEGLQSIPLVFVLTGFVLYTVLGGADFGAGFWQLLRAVESAPSAYRNMPTSRWARSGRPTTCG